jgi:hypothetical protein
MTPEEVTVSEKRNKDWRSLKRALSEIVRTKDEVDTILSKDPGLDGPCHVSLLSKQSTGSLELAHFPSTLAVLTALRVVLEAEHGDIVAAMEAL